MTERCDTAMPSPSDKRGYKHFPLLIPSDGMGMEHFDNPNVSVVVSKCWFLGFLV